jgi:alkanesulfonate monooxygenase SsuD/methylene tetrahydromethanopterin reductase-like flavin-dependent oxidoreductase (luciferase family)
MPDLSFGIFDHLDKQSRPLRETYADRLKLLEIADRAGFYSYHLAEHHATPLCMAPSPSVFLASLAQRTRTLRFGPLVYLLPLYDPLRLIEEICMLDHLSNGRLELGVGRGISPIELGFHGIVAAESRPRFLESLEIIINGLQTQRLTHHGRFYNYDNVPIELYPVQQPHPPIWYPTSNFDGMTWIAERGYSTVLQGAVSRVKDVIARYWEVYKGDESSKPKVGVVRTIFIADSEQEAKRIAAPNFKQHYESLIKLWYEYGQPTAAEAFTGDLDEEIAHDKAYIGTVSSVRDQVATFFETSGCDYLVCRPMFGDLPTDRALDSFQRFVDEVMPSFVEAPQREASIR